MHLINKRQCEKDLPSPARLTSGFGYETRGLCRVAYGRVRPEEKRVLDYSGVARPQPLPLLRSNLESVTGSA